MNIKIVEVTSKSQLDEYIRLPELLNSKNNIYFGSTTDDALEIHNSEKNVLLNKCQTIKYLAYKDSECVGRIMGIIHEPWNETYNKRYVRFFQLDYSDSIEVGDALMNAIGSWAIKFDINTLIGPLGFHELDPQGCLIEGITKYPVLNAPAEFTTVPAYIHKPDVDILYDLFSYLIPVPETDPEFLIKIRDRTIARGEFKILNLKSSSDLDPWIDAMLVLLEQNEYNKFGYRNMTSDIFKKHFLESYPLLTFKFFNIVIDSKARLVAFTLAHPNISESILKFRKNIGIMKDLKLRTSLKKAERLDLFTMTIDKRVRGLGINASLILNLFESCRMSGIKNIDSNVIHEANRLARLECIKLKGEHYKMYRVFKKDLK